MSETLSGHCLCGQVQYSSTGRSTWECFCHCNDCRRNCASPVVAFLGVKLNGFIWTVKGKVGAEPKCFQSSTGVKRYFCDQCGTPMGFQAEHYKGEIHLYDTTLEKPEQFAPEFHVHYDSKLKWLHIEDDLKKYTGSAPADEALRVQRGQYTRQSVLPSKPL